jgi:hypothetical protein
MALRLHYRRWYPLILPGGSVAVFAAWRFAGAHTPEVLISGIGVVTGFTYFVYKQHLDETKLFSDLFVGFNERYDNLNGALNAILFGPDESDLSGHDRDILFHYFNLCAEEYLFHKAGYIDHTVWESWCGGMDAFFRHPRIRALWDADSKSNSYYGFDPDKLP